MPEAAQLDCNLNSLMVIGSKPIGIGVLFRSIS